jgi:hypothetical protein
MGMKGDFMKKDFRHACSTMQYCSLLLRIRFSSKQRCNEHMVEKVSRRDVGAQKNLLIAAGNQKKVAWEAENVH